ncbi:hypothetical protein BH09PAT4_BH09PAT4_01930 [soil metagenome]
MDSEKPLKFSDYEKRMIPLLEGKLKQLGVTDPMGFGIVGVTTHFIQDEFGNKANINIGGKNLPVVMVAGNSTYAIYYFALRPLIDELESKEDG